MKYYFLLLIVIINSSVFSQNLSTKSKKAEEFFYIALENYQTYNYDKAIYWAEQALAKDENFIEVYYLLSDIYGETKQIDRKILMLKKAIVKAPQKNALAYFTLAKTELSVGKYADAERHILELKTYDTDNRFSEETKDLLKKAEFGIKAIENPVEFKPINAGKNINSEFDEYFPVLTADEQTLIYTRLIPNGKILYDGSYDFQEDFFISKKHESEFLASENFGVPLNTFGNEGAQTISADGKILFLTSCEYERGKSPHGKTYGSCDLFVSYKTGDKWSVPENIGQPVNTKYWESQPSFSADGKTLYFVSNRPDGLGKEDIWKSELKSDGTWSEPVNLGTTINTDKHEQSPFIHYDNQTLYFSSDGHLGMGKQDLFFSKIDSSGNYTTPVNLSYPINTYDEEVSLTVNTKGNKAYYSSSKKSEYGGLDIYSFELPTDKRPEPVTYVKGIVYDAETSARLSAEFKLINLNTADTVAQSISDKETGQFLICLPAGHSYAFSVSKPGYLFFSESFVLEKNSDASDSFILDIPLSPIKIGKKSVLKNVFFATDSYELDSKSYIELKKLVTFLETNPAVNIEIGGHTDNTGSESHNLQLSLKRAVAVFEYLISKGIDKNRVRYKGYGSSSPKDTNETETGRQNNRRTEFKVI
jgi:outer membrane protein OmpA-like peptidoglycan-associated protein/tetratricopeptide (TPR) repeat protein